MQDIKILLILFAVTILGSCSNDKDNIGITKQSWTKDTSIEISFGPITQVTFSATGDWTASSNADWCYILTTSGKKGDAVFKITASSTTQTERNAVIDIKVNGSSSTKLYVVQKVSTTPVSEDMEINNYVDNYLREYYLWNDEYKTLTLDKSKSYQKFFEDALMSMNTNTLDKRLYDKKYKLFSYIEKINSVTNKKSIATRSTKYINKELQYSFGIADGIYYKLGTEKDYSIYLFIQGVYPGSPADKAGLKRGSIISKINGAEITNNNYESIYYQLTSPTSAQSVTVTEGYKTTQDITFTSEAMYCNPIIKNDVRTIGTHKIGYLVYSSFDAGFDEELFDVFKDFKKQNITDLILDLRYNGGGHTISANLIASCIAGEACKNKVFASYRYNAERMKKLNNKRDEDLFAIDKYTNLGTSLTDGALGLKKVYCIVGNATASASELVINSLRGIDIDVVLIGEKTTGKNVGMEYSEFTVRNNKYRVVPITFQSYNAKGFGDYESGFTPEQGFVIDETNPDNSPNSFTNYVEFGNNDEPLYAKAIETITGQKIAKSRSTAPLQLTGTPISIKAKCRPGFNGMLKEAK